jgi:hypothetical protein
MIRDLSGHTLPARWTKLNDSATPQSIARCGVREAESRPNRGIFCKLTFGGERLVPRDPCSSRTCVERLQPAFHIHLLAIEPRVQPVPAHELCMTTLLNNLAAIEHQDAVSSPDCR